MNNNQIAPHEILELHELLSANIVSAKKLDYVMSMIQDESLKNVMQNSLNNKKARIQELQNFINSQIGNQLNNVNTNQNNNQNDNSNNNQNNNQS